MIDGTLTSDPKLIADHVVDFYSKLFAANEPTVRDFSFVDTVISPSISKMHALNLTAIPNAIEIRAAVFSMDGLSSPGPDGYGGAFYHNYWSIISEDIVRGVQTFFMKNYLPKGFNSSTVILLLRRMLLLV